MNAPLKNCFQLRHLVSALAGIPALCHRWPWPSFDLHLLQYVRMADNVIRLWNEMDKGSPGQLIDVGANRSQVARWLAQEWPAMDIQSFEPNPALNPIGIVHRTALSDFDGVARFKCSGANDEMGHLDVDGEYTVAVKRLDAYPLKFKSPVMLKIDTETHSYRTLIGAEGILNRVEIVLMEVWNEQAGLREFKTHIPFVNRQAEIWSFLWQHGFHHARIVDAWFTPGGWVSTDVAFYK